MSTTLSSLSTSISAGVAVAVNFLFQLIFGFLLFLNSLAYITILRNNGKIEIN